MYDDEGNIIQAQLQQDQAEGQAVQRAGDSRQEDEEEALVVEAQHVANSTNENGENAARAEGNQMYDIDSIVLEDSESQNQPSQQQQQVQSQSVRVGWGEPIADSTSSTGIEVGQPNLADKIEQNQPDDEPEEADEESTQIDSQHRRSSNRHDQDANTIDQQEQAQSMLVDEQAEVQDLAKQREGYNMVVMGDDITKADAQHCIQIVGKLVADCNEIANLIRSNNEPAQYIMSVVDSLRKDSELVLFAIHKVLSPEQSTEFIQNLRKMSIAMLEETILMESSYVVAIFQFFHTVIVKLYGPLIERLDMCQLVEQLLRDRASLYQAIFPPPQKRRNGANITTRNQQQALDDKKREGFRNALDLEHDNRVYDRIQRDSDWRNQLREGDLIDALAQYKTPQSSQYRFIQGWAHAKIIAVDDQKISISFVGRGQENDRVLNKESLDIADILPYGTYTDKVQWKDDLEEGDLLDACDDYGLWYRSTLHRKYKDSNKVDCDGNPIEMLHIVCRYPDDEGVKVKDGIKVTGWLRDEFDLIIEKNAPCIKLFTSYTTQYMNVGPEEMKYDLEVNDQEDWLYQTEKISQYGNHRKGHFGGIKFIGTIVDDFGLAGGFQSILDLFQRISKGEFKTTVEHMSLIMFYLATTLPFWTREFMCTKIGIVVEKFLSILQTQESTNPLNQPHTRGHINILINNYHKLLTRYFVARKHNKMINYMNSLVGCSLLKLENLEKRIFGIKLIADQIGNLPYMDQNLRRKEEIIADLDQLNAFEIIFSAKNFHLQILQRAEDVLRLYAQTQSLTPEMVNLLWETRQMDETACIQVYTIITECIYVMPKEIVVCFVDKIKNIAPSSLQLRDVELVYNIGKQSSQTDQSRYCADALWDIIFNKNTGYSQSVLKVARKKLCELLRVFDTNAKIEFINQCVFHVSDPTVISLQVLKIMFKTISWLPRHQAWMNSTSITMRTFVTDLITDMQIIDILLQDLESYKLLALKDWQPDNETDLNVFSPRTIDTYPLFTEGFTHSKNLEVRLNGLLFILESVIIQGPRISAEQLQRLWDIMIVNTKLPGDQRVFFRFFRRVLQERDWLDPRLICQFFEEKIEQNHQVVEEISIDGFLSIQTMFLYINELQNFITIIKQPVEDKKSGDNMYGKSGSMKLNKLSRRNGIQGSRQDASQNKNNSTKGKLEFRVHQHPSKLRGIEIIWLIFQQSPSRDLDLITQVVLFLAQVYHSISRVLEDQRQAVYSDFVRESLQRLKDTLESDIGNFDVHKRDLVKNTMLMLQNSLIDTEICGSAGIRPHYNIDLPCQTIEDITVQSYLTRDGQPKYYSFSVDSKMTVWEFIDLIARTLNLSPRKIKIQRILNQNQAYNSKKPEITNEKNCKTLSELKVENGEEFTIMRNLNQTEKVPLTNPQNNEMVPDVQIIFENWFDQYARPKEEFEDADQLTEEKYMDKKSCCTFMASTVKDQRLSGNSYQEAAKLTESSNTITNLYQEYDEDDDGRLTKADFLRFYKFKCVQNPSVVWMNLEKHNVGKDLHHGQASDLDLTYINDTAVIRNQEELPRYFISTNQEQFNQLFDLESFLATSGPQYQQQTMESVWQLIGCLKTNPKLYLSLLRNENLEERIGQPENVSNYRLLYQLQIIHSLMENYRSKPESIVSMYRENRKSPLWGNAQKDAVSNNNDFNENFPRLDEESKTNEERGPASNTNGNYQLDQVMEEGQDEENIAGLATANEANLGFTEPDQNSNGHSQQKNIPVGQPIALPDAATVNQQQASNTDKFNNNLSHSKRQILNWKGEIVHERLQISQVCDKELIDMINSELNERKENGEQLSLDDETILASPQDYLQELKQRWLIEFIENKGFEYLINIMKTIVNKYSNVEKSEILNVKAEVNTLMHAAQMIKVVLVSYFCSQTQDSNLVGNLQRKMSSVRDEDSQMTGQQQSQPKGGPQQNQLISKQQDISNEFKQLTQIFTGESEVASKLLQSIDLTELQDLLQLILRIILKKQSTITEQHKQVVTECLDIWVSCITFENELLINIYGEDETQSTEIVTMLLEQGLFSEMSSQRRQFKEAIEFMSFNIKTGLLPMAPATFFLQKLLGQLEHSKTLMFTRTPEFFELLIKLVEHYFKMKIFETDFQEIFDPALLIKDLIAQLGKYKSQESKTSVIADHTLVGIIKLAQTLLEANTDILDQSECSNIMVMLIKQCLFNQRQQAYQGHITSNIDLSSHLSSQINKCHTDESRNAAYSLLDSVIKSNSDPRIIQTLVEDFWNPFILQLTKQKESGVAPQDSGRSVFQYAGLKNLGCICYMNSMLQQMFNVPSFRYSLLGTDDRQPNDMQVDSRGVQVDNNSLHQWLKMFSFLQMTDRQEYNPRDFCFAFKENNGDPTNVRVQQDAQEFLNLGFDRLENMLKDTPQKYITQNVFQGQTSSVLVCKDCGNIVCKDDDFYTLSCLVKNQKTLQSSLESMIAGEMIEGYNCSACKKKVTIEKKQTIKSLPNTLIVHLNRIVFDFESMRNVKLNDKLDFPNELNVRPFMLHQVLADMKKNEQQQKAQANEMADNEDAKLDDEEVRGASQAQAAQQNNDEANEDSKIEDEQEKAIREEENRQLQELIKEGQKATNEEFDYKLVGVVIHMGIADAGHYLSYINIERDGDAASQDRAEWMRTDKQTWLEFNDSVVSAFDFSQMQYKAFGEDENSNMNSGNVIDYTNDINTTVMQSHNAYMLIYEKADKKPLKVVCSQDNLNLIKAQPRSVIQKLDIAKGPLSCDGTAIPRDINEEGKTQRRESKKEDQAMISTSAMSSSGSMSKLAGGLTLTDQAMSSSDTEMSEASSARKQAVGQSHVEVEEDKEMEEFMARIPHSFLIYPGLVSSLYENSDQVLKFDEEKKEHFVEVPFHNIKQFVPNDYYKQVHDDNQLFLAEKQVFCTPFFKTSAQLIEQYLNSVDQEAQVVSEEETSLKRLQIYQVLDKLIFDMLINGTEAQQQNLPQMTKLLFRVLDQSDEALFSLVQNRILIGIDDNNDQGQQTDTNQIDTSDKKPKTLEDKLFLDMLVTGRTIQVRELAEQVLSNVMLKLFSKLDSEKEMVDKSRIQEVIERITQSLLSLIPNEVQKFWHKLGPFFNFFYNMVQDFDLRRVSYFLREGLITSLIDLTGRYNSQVEYSVPPFDKLVATVCILARSQPLIIYLFGIPDEFQVSEDELRQEINSSVVSPNWIFNSQQDPSKGQVVHESQAPLMSTQEVRALVMVDKRSKDFFNIALKNTQESRNVALMIGHLCWGNYEISRRFGKIILKGLNSTNELEVKPFVDCMTTYLSLDDQFQEERVEWLMGIGCYTLARSPQYNNYRVGVNTITNIQDSIVDYQSNLFKTKTDLDETVLCMMYKYRKERFVRASLALLEGVTWIMAHCDNNNVLLKYILTIEPPAYTCQRYWDWIEPHIRDHIQHCSNNANYATSGEELETCMRIYSNIEHIKNQFGTLVACTENQQHTEEGIGGRPVPDPYLMWHISSEDRIASFPAHQDANVVVSLHECTTEISKSRPDGSTNGSLEQKWHNARIRFVPKSFKTAKKQSKGGYGVSKQTDASDRKSRWYNKSDKRRSKEDRRSKKHDSQDADDSSDNEQTRPEKPSNSMHAVNDLAAEGDQKPERQEPQHQDQSQVHGQGGASEPDQEMLDFQNPTQNSQVDELGDGGEVNTEPQNENHTIQQQQEEDDTAEIGGNNEQDEQTEFDPLLSEGQLQPNPTVNMFEDPQANGAEGMNEEPEPAPINENTAAEDSSPIITEAMNADTNMIEGLGQDANQQTGEEEEKQEPEKDDEEQDEVSEDPKTQQPTLIVFMIDNKSRYDARVSIVFNQENRKNVNFRQPCTEFTEVCVNGKSKLPLRFAKVRLDKDWGNFLDFKIIINGTDVLTDQKWDRYERDHPILRENKIPLMMAAEAQRIEQEQLQNVVQDDDQQQYVQHQSQQQYADVPSNIPDIDPEDFGKINCPVCTFLNPPHNNMCEVCGSGL